MMSRFNRTELLIGKENIDELKNKRVAIFGIGGVGGYTVEALVRAGINNIILIIFFQKAGIFGCQFFFIIASAARQSILAILNRELLCWIYSQKFPIFFNIAQTIIKYPESCFYK